MVFTMMMAMHANHGVHSYDDKDGGEQETWAAHD